MKPDAGSRDAPIVGTLLFGVPILDLVLGAEFGAFHAVLGSAGLAVLVPAMLGKEA